MRAEATSPQGGVAYLRDQLSNRDFPAVLEFTKTYDGVLRKRLLGRAKKQLELSSNEFVSNPQQQKELLVLATNIANAVTFDLIGMNRSSRPGQESAEQAAKYLQELQDDLQRFLDLEPQ